MTIIIFDNDEGSTKIVPARYFIVINMTQAHRAHQSILFMGDSLVDWTMLSNLEMCQGSSKYQGVGSQASYPVERNLTKFHLQNLSLLVPDDTK